ncbi:MAG: NAD(P)/FAD-dependent oxidoreductase, partial [Anaerolineaceae bacterium]|nr:NAD(P)/FAD-dependent oxidoreductase [Anaerolineaceae bacterium]
MKNITLPHVVILGAGFGGLQAARSLAGKPVQVTLVDRNNYHLFQPLLYQVATSMLSADEIAYPIRSTLSGDRKRQFHLGEVSEVNLCEKCVVTNNGNIAYDYLIVALGGESNYFGIRSVAQHSFGLKNLDDAVSIRNHLLQQFEKAAAEENPEKRRAYLTFVIVGGGPTGVECAGAISELIRIVLKKDYPDLDISEIRVILIEAEDLLLGMMPRDLGEATAEVLKRKHVEVWFNSLVTNNDGKEVQLKDGKRIQSHTLIWAAGIRAAHLLDTLGLEQDRLGRIKVQPTLQVAGHPEIYAIGDAASLAGKDGRPLPMVAPVAIQQAHTAAKNILNQLQGKPGEEFSYRDP